MVSSELLYGQVGGESAEVRLFKQGSLGCPQKLLKSNRPHVQIRIRPPDHWPSPTSIPFKT
jgi:hypothetical protein